MQDMDTGKRCFKINNIDYYLKLIPKKYEDSDKKRPPFLTRLGMALSEIYHFTKVKGIVQYEKKMWGPLYLKKLDKWKKIGKFTEEWHEALEECWHYLTINLTKEHPKKKMLIESAYSDIGTATLNKILIEKIGRKNKRSPLEEI